MVELKCDWCGKSIRRYVVHKHNFCSRACLASFSSKSKNPNGYNDLKDYKNMSRNMTRINEELNPSRMTPEVREKIRLYRMTSGEGKTYAKIYGVHEHRVVAERMLKRSLRPGEVVHHRDGDKRNNCPENLLVFNTQAEHAKHHAELNWFIKELEKLEGGDA